MKISDIKKHWTDQAIRHGANPAASWTDTYAIELEISRISQRLNDGDTVIDLGCANGYSTIHYALQHRIDIIGIDYIPEMIASAKSRLTENSKKIKGKIDFHIGDVAALDNYRGFDKAIMTRVLINLGDWNRQANALRNIANTLKPGGLLLMSEATLGGLDRLNKLRREFGFSPLPQPPFNNYIDETNAAEAARDLLDLVEVEQFSSTYYLGTRVLKPLLAKLLGNLIDPARPDMELNRLFSILPSIGDYGVQKLFIYQRK